jgi:p-cumate 2,3-dioxygenase beta subunit
MQQKEEIQVNAGNKSLEALSRQEVEDFLYKEAYLLDEWELDEWLGLYAQDAEYLVPTNDLGEAADPNNNLVYINHDFERLQALTVRLKDRRAHREYPWSNTRHLITNVRLMGMKDENLMVTANFLVWRFRNKDTEYFVGYYRYALRLVDGQLKIRSKHILMDMTSLRPAGAISIIL